MPPAGFDADDLESRLVWIMGSPRSGSTWLLQMLASAPGVIGIDEPLIGMHLAIVAARAPYAGGDPGLHLQNADLENRDSYFFSKGFAHVWQPLMRDAILGRLWAEVEPLASSAGLERPLVVVKEPNGSHAAEIIFSILPRSRLIFLLRDGRDVVDSGLDVALKPGWTENLNPGQEPVADETRLAVLRNLAGMWVLCSDRVRGAFERLDEAQRLQLRYEEMLADPFAALELLRGWLPLGADDDKLRRIVEERAFEAIPADQRGSGHFARAASPGLWKENLKPAEQEAMEEVMGPTLRELGYR